MYQVGNITYQQPWHDDTICCCLSEDIHVFASCHLYEFCLRYQFTSIVSFFSLSASSCLDFLSAMMNNPRLWQGRENKQDNVEEEKQNTRVRISLLSTRSRLSISISLNTSF